VVHLATMNRGEGVIITKLAELPAGSLLDETALAQALVVTKRTVRRMVGRYELPPPIQFGGRSTWQAGSILRWFESRAGKAARKAQRRATAFDRNGP
jgi:predicted DNA-binding transcriptional regulator AlpA